MRVKYLLTVGAVLGVLAAGPAFAQSKVVTIYAADGLHDGSPNWFQTEFDAFAKETGIRVQYVEAGSAGVVARLEREKSNPQADVLVTLPPFIQKAAGDGVLAKYTPPAAAHMPAENKDPNGYFYVLVNNYENWIYNHSVLKAPPENFEALLEPKFKNKIQYSTPGQAGDGTSVMLNAFHVFGGKDAGYAYLKKLQANNLGPSSSTGRLTALVNKGEIWVSNGDVQMNLVQMADNPNIRIFFPAGPNGKSETFAVPYDIALVHGAPHEENGKKLIDFLLGKEAQSRVAELAKGLPARDDVPTTGPTFQQIHDLLKDVTIWAPDWSKVAQDLGADVSEYHRQTGG